MTDDVEYPTNDDTGELEPVAEPPPDGAVTTSGRGEHHMGSVAWVLTQGALAAVLLVLVILNPYGFTSIEEIAGFGLVVFGLFELLALVRAHRGVGYYVQPLASLVAGVVLIIWPAQTLAVVGYIIAGVILVRGVSDVWSSIRRWHMAGSNAWVFVRGLLEIGAGALVLLFPGQAVAFIVFFAAILAVGRAVIAVIFAFTSRDAVATFDPADTYAIVAYWLSRHEMDAAAADQVEDRVFLHRHRAKESITRFSILMALATSIATFGIATDSTAVVIGAMLVAPLMTPILGTAAGLINGKSRATTASIAIAGAGSLGSIVLAFLLATAIPDLEAVVQNAQVVSRTTPNLLDLAIALAAGAAGAYGVSRAESTDALPGVAVAIALVPPLAVVGITLRAGDIGQSTGALLLFGTNFFSILLMAGIVFVLVGYGSWSRLYERRDRIRVSFAAVALGVILISIPLALTARRIVTTANDLRVATNSVDEWLGQDTQTRISSIKVDKDQVTVELIGPDDPPSAATLSGDISEQVGRPIVAIVRWIDQHEDVGVTPESDL